MNYLVNTSFNSSVLSLRLAAFLDCPNLRAIKLCFHKMDGWNLNFMLDNVKEKNHMPGYGKILQKNGHFSVWQVIYFAKGKGNIFWS